MSKKSEKEEGLYCETTFRNVCIRIDSDEPYDVSDRTKGPREAERLPANPQFNNGTWDISFDNGMSFKDATCVRWNTIRDETEWILPDGTRIVHNRNTVSVIPANNGGEK